MVMRQQKKLYKKLFIHYILILFLTIPGSVTFAGQLNKDSVSKDITDKTISSLTREIQDLKKSISLYKNKVIYLKSIIKAREKELDTIAKANVTLTGYHPWSNGINSDGSPEKTATMTRPVVGRTCAISSELVNRGWLGKRIYIEGIGVFKAEDRMSTSLNGLRIDLVMGSRKEALNFGKKKNILAINLN